MSQCVFILELVVLHTIFICFANIVLSAEVVNRDNLSEPLVQFVSADGFSVSNGIPVKVMLNDPSPSALRKVPLPAQYSMDPSTATSTVSIQYVGPGGTDKWGESCSSFPNNARTVFKAASNVWANILQSSVPITIQACWATDMGSPNILGYSGGGTVHRDYTGAPRSGTFYTASLANSLNGTDLDSSNADMHITYNSQFNWYYGTDGNPSVTQHDLFSVILHEIGHGLNFSGGMYVSGGIGYWYTSPYPNIYDTFMRDGMGNGIISSYSHGSSGLGNVLTSSNLYFHGSNAMAANGNSRVKMYAPSTWSSGSSYSHLDYNTFNDTFNQLMVYAISAGEVIHDPGEVTKGLLKDLGWRQSSSSASPCSTLTNGQAIPVNAASKQEKCYRINVPAGKTELEAKLYNLNGDLDLYTRYNNLPTVSANDCNSENGGTVAETCSHTNPMQGDWYIMVYGFTSGSGTLEVTTKSCLSAPTGPASIAYPTTSEEGFFTVSWSSSSGQDSYLLYLADNPSFVNPDLVYWGSSGSYTQEGLAKGTYYYRVAAVNDCGKSAYIEGGAIKVTMGKPFPWVTMVVVIAQKAGASILESNE